MFHKPLLITLFSKQDLEKVSPLHLKVQLMKLLQQALKMWLWTPWNKVPFEKLIFTDLVKKLFACYKTWSFTWVCQWSLSWAACTQYIPSFLISLRSVLIYYSPTDLFFCDHVFKSHHAKKNLQYSVYAGSCSSIDYTDGLTDLSFKDYCYLQ
jgi:hypothetical protein